MDALYSHSVCTAASYQQLNEVNSVLKKPQKLGWQHHYTIYYRDRDYITKYPSVH